MTLTITQVTTHPIPASLVGWLASPALEKVTKEDIMWLEHQSRGKALRDMFQQGTPETVSDNDGLCQCESIESSEGLATMQALLPKRVCCIFSVASDTSFAWLIAVVLTDVLSRETNTRPPDQARASDACLQREPSMFCCVCNLVNYVLVQRDPSLLLCRRDPSG